jgi:phosphate transport system permease protein
MLLGLCMLATFIGLMILISILWTLFSRGFGALDLAVFTESTPGPGDEGGLMNAIIGSLVLTAIGIGIATPLGVLAGTWLAEYGQNSRLATAIRFVNGVLMSAPSILIGLFVYATLVRPMGTYSGWAGTVALAVIALPVIVSTTEEMLRLVPQGLREAAAGLGTPQWLIIRSVCYKAAATGIMTGILLALARISGETAPLLFTALNNQFFSLNMNGPIANLPVTIYRFAMSPYDSWIDLAWAGALVITIGILFLNITARYVLYLKDRAKGE